jgi:hypothetical protein
LRKGEVIEGSLEKPRASLLFVLSGDVNPHVAGQSVTGTEHPEDFVKEVYGSELTTTLADLPAGEYVLEIPMAETYPPALGKRQTDIIFNGKVIEKDFDIGTAAQGLNKVVMLKKTVTHAGGSFTLTFKSATSKALLQTFTLRDKDGKWLAQFKASDVQ